MTQEQFVAIPPLLVSVLVLGWALACSMFGLWLGERGRRIDAQKREERIPVIEPKAPRPVQTRTEQVATPALPALEEGRQEYIETMIREGYSPDEAAADWDAMMEAQQGDQRG